MISKMAKDKKIKQEQETRLYLMVLELQVGSKTKYLQQAFQYRTIRAFNLSDHLTWQISNASKMEYSGDLKVNHQKSGNILKVEFQMVQFSNSRALVPNIRNRPSKIEQFCPDFKPFLTKCSHLSRFQMVVVQILFKSRFCNPISFRPCEIQTSQDLRSPLQSGLKI